MRCGNDGVKALRQHVTVTPPTLMQETFDPTPERMQEVIDDRVFNFAQAAQRHFSTNDLVVVLDLRDDSPELEALPRQRLADADELPLNIRMKFARPASNLKEAPGSPEQSFWFLVIFEDEEAHVAAINASLSASGGRA